LDRAKDPNFWSVRVNADVRLIVHRTANSILLCYVDHHDAAYKWAERRKIERHPSTGAMQLVIIPERVQESLSVGMITHVDATHYDKKPLLFDKLRRPELMSFGVPEEWVENVRKVDEDTLFDVIDHLPQEAQEALLRLAVGESPGPSVQQAWPGDAFAHPDAQRRFRILSSEDELRRALEAPWEKWAVFLHPAQAQLVERNFSGPARVSGSAGTGKTIVAIHRAVHLAKTLPEAQVLLTTYSKALANNLNGKVAQLVGSDEKLANRIIVKPITIVGYDLYSQLIGQPNIASASVINSLLEAAEKMAVSGPSHPFLKAEWSDIIDAWQIDSPEAYAQVQRLGRKTRLGPKQREALWPIFEHVRTGLEERKLVTWAMLFGRVTAKLAESGQRPFDFAVADEAQDLRVAEVRFLAKLLGDRSNGLFFSGDLGQRIFQQPFSWKSLGADVRGRSATLRINYRTSHQIRRQADRLLPNALSDVDGNAEIRKGTVSVFEGPEPLVRLYRTPEEERKGVVDWIKARLKEGVEPHEIGIFVRSQAELVRARAAAEEAGVKAEDLDGQSNPPIGAIAVATMHLAKGLEFRSVAAMACDDEVLPQQQRIESVSDESDLQEVNDTERHLLYVACTRARDDLLVSGVEPGSEFLGDLSSAGQRHKQHHLPDPK
jgi:hypothetical protein